MKARVYVSFKETVLDPQGKTVCSALQGMGYSDVESVRQGKFFEIGLKPGANIESAKKQIEEAAHAVLANPVIEEFRVEILD
jgi:phosphoribosylformylglycinamidine synthase